AVVRYPLVVRPCWSSSHSFPDCVGGVARIVFELLATARLAPRQVRTPASSCPSVARTCVLSIRLDGLPESSQAVPYAACTYRHIMYHDSGGPWRMILFMVVIDE